MIASGYRLHVEDRIGSVQFSVDLHENIVDLRIIPCRPVVAFTPQDVFRLKHLSGYSKTEFQFALKGIVIGVWCHLYRPQSLTCFFS